MRGGEISIHLERDFSVTVIIVTYKRALLLERAVRTLAHAISLVGYKVNVKVLINGEDPESLQVCHSIMEKWPQIDFDIKTIPNKVTPAEARNRLIDSADKGWYFFMDDDVQIPAEIFKDFERLCRQFPGRVAWGGPNLTPVESPLVALKNGWFVENFMVVGPICFRYRKRGQAELRGGQFNLMLCNLFVKSHFFESERFATHLKTAEENGLLYRISDLKSEIGYSDDLYVWHERRPQLQGFLRQIFYYGYGRGQLLLTSPISSQWLFVVFLMSFFFSGFVFLNWPLQAGLFLLLWLLVVKISYWRKFKTIVPIHFFVPLIVWVLYSLGLMNGIYERLMGKVLEKSE